MLLSSLTSTEPEGFRITEVVSGQGDSGEGWDWDLIEEGGSYLRPDNQRYTI